MNGKKARETRKANVNARSEYLKNNRDKKTITINTEDNRDFTEDDWFEAVGYKADRAVNAIIYENGVMNRHSFENRAAMNHYMAKVAPKGSQIVMMGVQ